MYAELLLRKLPQKLRDNINRANSNNVWNLENLRQAIAAEISHLQALEDCQFTSENKSYNSNVSSFNTNVKSYRKSCLFCSKGHKHINVLNLILLEKDQTNVR